MVERVKREITLEEEKSEGSQEENIDCESLESDKEIKQEDRTL